MARPKLADQQPGMAGGLNDVSDPSALQPNQLRRAINLRLTDYGAATKRGGTQRTHSTALGSLGPTPISNGFTFQQDNGTNQILVTVSDKMYYATYGTLPWTYTIVPSATLALNVSPDFAQFRDAGGNDVVYIADGGLLNRWNGTTLTQNIAGTAGVTVLQVHNQRLWGCGATNYPDSIFYSSLNNGDDLGNAVAPAGGGQIIVRTFGDERIVGLASVNTSLLIFHRRGISRLTGYGQDDITAAPAGVTADVGTIAAKSIVANNNVAYFISERGLYRCNESEVAAVGTPEKPDPLLPIIRQLSSADFDGIRAVMNRATKELWITIPGYGCYQYHTVLDAWSGPWDGGYTDPNTTCLFETINSSGLPVVLKGDAEGWVSLCDAPGVYKDNVLASGGGGAPYTMIAQLHRMYCGDDAEAKALRWGYVTAQLNQTTNCVVEWETNESSGSYQLPVNNAGIWDITDTWDVADVWAYAVSNNYRIPMGGTGYYIDISIVDTGQALPVISRFQLETFALGRR